MFNNQTINEVGKIAEKLGVQPAALLAVAEVESAGKAYAVINGRNEPLIRFEGHYFDRRLAGAKREKARRTGLSHPSAGQVGNPSAQALRWDLLKRAEAIDHKAAYESVSWGVGQVMGAHWAWLGYDNVDALVAEARNSIGGQVELMGRYIDKAGLIPALKRQDWAAFARGYNGPDYKRHGYDRKIAAAYARYRRLERIESVAARTVSIIARGAAGPHVVEVQTMLTAAGHPVARDGIFGLQTEHAVRRFQAAHGLDVDGFAGPQTISALGAALTSGGWWSRAMRWLGSLLD